MFTRNDGTDKSEGRNGSAVLPTTTVKEPRLDAGMRDHDHCAFQVSLGIRYRLYTYRSRGNKLMRVLLRKQMRTDFRNGGIP